MDGRKLENGTKRLTRVIIRSGEEEIWDCRLPHGGDCVADLGFLMTMKEPWREVVNPRTDDGGEGQIWDCD